MSCSPGCGSSDADPSTTRIRLLLCSSCSLDGFLRETPPRRAGPSFAGPQAMIAKILPLSAVRADSFRRLANYMVTGKRNVERVGAVRVVNCEGLGLEWAVAEIAATQAANTRAASGKTYHLLLSFPPGERPEAHVLEAIEDRIVASLGFGEHQRVSAVHTDTDHLHIHIAINKIHPRTLALHSPRRDFLTLGEVCAQLETEFGLVQTRHARSKSHSEGCAQDMERIGSQESLQGFLRRECAEQLRGASDWQAVHSLLSSHGVALKPRGAGLVFVSSSGAAVRASVVAREFSLSSLETRLGSYLGPTLTDGSSSVSPGEASTHGRRRYEKRPPQRSPVRDALYAQYDAERAARLSMRAPALARVRGDVAARVEAAKAASRRRRFWIKANGHSPESRHLLYARDKQLLRRDIKRTIDQAAPQRAVVLRHTRMASWNDWLRTRASQGDAAALTALRERQGRAAWRGASLAAPGEHAVAGGVPAPGRRAIHVTAAGTVWERVDGHVVRNDGRCVHLDEHATDAALRVALREAVASFGKRLNVAGSAEFQLRVVAMAIEAVPAARFADDALERVRLDLVQTRNRDGNEGNGSAIARGAAGTAAGTGRRHARFGWRENSRGGWRPGWRAHSPEKSSTRAAGAVEAAKARDGVRILSARGLVRIADLAAVLLRSHAHHHVEQPKPAQSDRVRRSTAGEARVDSRARKSGRGGARHG